MICGIVNVYKEAGYTSHDVVGAARRLTGQRKIGHTGTLDPDAVGVLPLCFGSATKVCGLLTDMQKVYRARLLLGRETDTQDISGQVLEERPAETDTARIRAAIGSFVGDYQQIPPMYSARKIRGKKLYEMARAGQTVEREPRAVTIFSIDIEEMNPPEVVLKVACSKGTYIRTLCHDIGRTLGCGGCMSGLERLQVGPFRAEDAHTLGQIREAVENGRLDSLMIGTDTLFPEYEAVTVRPDALRLLEAGGFLRPWQLEKRGAQADPPRKAAEAKASGTEAGRIRVYRPDGQFMALYLWDEARGFYIPEKMFPPG